MGTEQKGYWVLVKNDFKHDYCEFCGEAIVFDDFYVSLEKPKKFCHKRCMFEKQHKGRFVDDEGE